MMEGEITYKTLLYSLCAYIGVLFGKIGLQQELVYTLVFAIGVDTLTGVYLAYKSKILSSQIGWQAVITKGLGLLVLTAVGMGLKVVAHIEVATFVNLAFGVLIFNEILSAIGNMYAIKTGEKLKEVDALALLLKRLHTWLFQLIEKIINDKTGGNNGNTTTDKDE